MSSVIESTSFVVDVQQCSPGDYPRPRGRRPAEGMKTQTPEQTAESFVWFHNNNPHVYEALLSYARRVKADPNKADDSFGLIFETVRADLNVHVTNRVMRGVRLISQFRKFYVRMIMLRHPGEFKWTVKSEKDFDSQQFLLDNAHRISGLEGV